jgi:hypothetical protein
MSISAMADNRLLRTEAPAAEHEQLVAPIAGRSSALTGVLPAPRPQGISSDALSSLTTWIPAETITAYVGAQALLGNLAAPQGKPLHDADFTTRWVVFALALAITPVIVWLFTKIKSRGSHKPFEWPVFEMVVASLSFVLWAVALPDTPANGIAGWQPWWGGAAIIFITPLVSLSAEAFGFTPGYEKVS